jgi:hypothetical protein
VKERAALNSVATMPDSEIDTSDSPEVRNWKGAVRGALYRPVKRLTSLRLDADPLEWFRRGGEAPGRGSARRRGSTSSVTSGKEGECAVHGGVTGKERYERGVAAGQLTIGALAAHGAEGASP